jgi:hypothetical protein
MGRVASLVRANGCCGSMSSRAEYGISRRSALIGCLVAAVSGPTLAGRVSGVRAAENGLGPGFSPSGPNATVYGEEEGFPVADHSPRSRLSFQPYFRWSAIRHRRHGRRRQSPHETETVAGNRGGPTVPRSWGCGYLTAEAVSLLRVSLAIGCRAPTAVVAPFPGQAKVGLMALPRAIRSIFRALKLPQSFQSHRRSAAFRQRASGSCSVVGAGRP